MSQYDRLVWIPNKSKNTKWYTGKLLSQNDTKVIVYNEEQQKEEEVEWDCLLWRKHYEIIPENLINLTYLHEPSLYYSLKQRFLNNKIYTKTGRILVAINPYDYLPIYTEDWLNKFSVSTTENLDSHIFSIARDAYLNICKTNLEYSSVKQNQSILISGESGAGKTESTKLLMKYYSYYSSSIKNDNISNIEETTIEQLILDSNPIIEAFGNASTERNHNSSRFGKFIRLFFNNKNKMIGASIDTYLLEIIRVLSPLQYTKSVTFSYI